MRVKTRRKNGKKNSFIGVVSIPPWYVGVILGLGLFVLLNTFEHPVFLPLSSLPLVACWIGALVSFLRQKERRRLFNKQTSLQTLSQLSWQEFEKVVGEHFRQKGFLVFETGLGGPDGGVDLVIKRKNKTFLVQCKHWQRKSVPVTTVREMWGLRDHHKAQGVKIVSWGDFTPDAFRFSKNKDIDLISGKDLVRGFNASVIQPSVIFKETCPSCQSIMHKRTNNKTKEKFWGCSSFPVCRATKPYS